MHHTCLWAANSANFARELAELTVFGRLVRQIYRKFHYYVVHRGIAAELLAFWLLLFFAADFSAEFLFSFCGFLEGEVKSARSYEPTNPERIRIQSSRFCARGARGGATL